MGLHAYHWLRREHDFLQRAVLLGDDPFCVLARIFGDKKGSGYGTRRAEGTAPGVKPLIVST